MSFNTQPTRINELLLDSDQTWVSRKSAAIPSNATFSLKGGALDASAGTTLSRQTSSSFDSTSLNDGEFAVGDVSTTSAVLYFRSGVTTYQFIADSGSVL